MRPGAITPSMIRKSLTEAAVSFQMVDKDETAVQEGQSNGAPGQTMKHYSPNVPTFILGLLNDARNEDLASTVILDFGTTSSHLEQSSLRYATLSKTSDPVEASMNLYEKLRWAEQVPGARRILLPDLREVEDEEAEGVRDRIFRASSGVVLSQTF